MNLSDGPFKAIKQKTKIIEMRLNDERRKNIKENDIIIFHHNDNLNTLKCKVIKITKFNNFDEVYNFYDKKVLGYNDDEQSNPSDMLKYYTMDQILKYGVLAIEIELID